MPKLVDLLCALEELREAGKVIEWMITNRLLDGAMGVIIGNRLNYAIRSLEWSIARTSE